MCHCVFCQNKAISHQNFGKAVTLERLRTICEELIAQGAHNLNFVNPTHYAHVIAALLENWRPPVPVVFNTGGYDRVDTLRKMEGGFLPIVEGGPGQNGNGWHPAVSRPGPIRAIRPTVSGTYPADHFHENRVALRRRPSRGLLAGLWEYPNELSGTDGWLTRWGLDIPAMGAIRPTVSGTYPADHDGPPLKSVPAGQRPPEKSAGRRWGRRRYPAAPSVRPTPSPRAERGRTAGAIASIAFGLPVPAVDGNVLRVIARVTGDRGDISSPAMKKKVTNILAEIIPLNAPGDFNQAMMELGATICLPNGAPLCEKCPAGRLCRAFQEGRTGSTAGTGRPKAMEAIAPAV